MSGEATATRLTVGALGRVRAADRGEGRPPDRTVRRGLRRMARRVERAFGGPQDVEWALSDGRLWLLQARPVTAVGGRGRGPVLGPGPVAETFPAPLRPLEEDLWVPPLREAIALALRLTGAASPRRLARSPVVASVGGRVAADLDLLGVAPGRRAALARLDPRPPARRLAAAWRVGRLRRALPALVADLRAEVDRELTAVPPLGRLTDEQLLGVVDRCRVALRAVHGHEVLAGMLGGDTAGATAAGLAVRAVRTGQAAGTPPPRIVEQWPVALALTPPRLGPRVPLPSVRGSWPEAGADAGAGLADLGPRESLRLRARWLQELSAAAVGELARRRFGRPGPDLVAGLTFAELVALVRHEVPFGAVPADPQPDSSRPDSSRPDGAATAGPPLPARFRLGPRGEVVPAPELVRRSWRARTAGQEGSRALGVAGGRAWGRVRGADEPGPGGVLVVRTLDPALAALLGELDALVAETGSALSHLAILAREHGIPTVVGVADAVGRFPPGCRVVVDGGTGEVSLAASEEVAT